MVGSGSADKVGTLAFLKNSLYPLCIFYSFLIAVLAILYEEGLIVKCARFPTSKNLTLGGVK